MKLRRISTNALGDAARNAGVSPKRQVWWSLAWIIVSVPLTLALTAPMTTPAADYARAVTRAQQLEPLFTAATSVDASGSVPAPSLTHSVGGNENRGGSLVRQYLVARAAERERHAEAFPWNQRLATLEIVLLSMCVVPAWFALSALTRR